MARTSPSTDPRQRSDLIPRPGLLASIQYYRYLPYAFLDVIFFAFRCTQRNLKDLHALLFLLETSLLYVFGFKGQLRTPFGSVGIRSRSDVKSAAYGVFKTHFSYLKEIATILPHREFFPIVVDVGANIGDFTLAMASRCGRVIAIEPGLENFRSLESNIAANRIGNALLLNIAAHDKEDALTLQGMNSMLHVTNSGTGEVAKGLPLDQVLNELKAKHVDILKVDVQGHEEKVLYGMSDLLSDKRIGMLVVEAHPRMGIRASNITTIMKSYGYTLVMNDDYLFHQPHLYYVPKSDV